jgi:Na+/melibiose symporter-like transporter
MLLLSAAIFGMFFFLILHMQQVLGYNALKTGVAYLPLSLTIVSSSALASRFVDRFTPRPVLVFGLLLAVVGFLLLTRVSGSGDYASHILSSMIVLGVGLGMAFG